MIEVINGEKVVHLRHLYDTRYKTACGRAFYPGAKQEVISPYYITCRRCRASKQWKKLDKLFRESENDSDT